MSEPRAMPGGIAWTRQARVLTRGLGMPAGLLAILVVVSLTTHEVPFLLEVLAVSALAIGVPIGLLLRADRRHEQAVRAAIAGQVSGQVAVRPSGQATVVRVEVQDSPADSSRTAARTGVRTALTAAPDSGQAVRVQVADR